MIQRISKACFIAFFLFVLGGMVPRAHAGNVDFICSGTSGALACTGTVATSGAYSTSGITVYNTDGTYTSTLPFASFNLVFNTTTSTISLTQLTGGSDTLSGAITSFTVSPGATTSTLVLNVAWNSPLPTAITNQLGTPGGLGQTSIILQIDPNTGKALSVDVTITPTPEPGTLVLLGSGLLGLAGILKRKIAR